MAKEQQKKPRKMCFKVGVVKGSDVDIVPRLDEQILEVRIRKDGKPAEPVNTVISTYYDRPRKIKVINQTSSAKRRPVLNLDASLARFDFVLAVDTNSDTCGGDKISVCCLVVGFAEKNEEGYGFVAAPQWCLEFWNSVENPEKFAWRKIIQMVQQTRSYSELKSYALVVDSFLSDIPDFNLGKPFIDDFRLPENMEMIYASSDVRNESIANRMLAASDERAKKLLEFICQHKDEDLGAGDTEEPGCSFYRVWYKTREGV